MSTDDFMDDLHKELNRVTPFTTPHVPTFINPELDFKVDPEHFMKWLATEDEEVTGDYRNDCGSMCEYSCLYLSMLLYNQELKGELTIICGNYGWWEHYWMKYKLNGITYYLDLTLMQFVEEAPKFAITLEHQNPKGYNSKYDMDGQDFRKYVDEKRGFDFYTNPKEIY